MSLMSRAADFLAGKLKSTSVAGRAVSYRRGALESSTIYGWVSLHREEALSEDDFATTYTVYDWTFETADLLLRGEAIEPRQSDQIIAGDEIYELCLDANSGKVHEHPDTSKRLTTVHTKRVS